MNCDGVRGLLSAYLDGELSPGDLLRVEQHLRRCHCCADEVDSLRQTIALVASFDEVEIPATFHAQLHDRLVALGPPMASGRRIPAAPAWQRNVRRWAVPAAAAAAALAIGLTSFPHAKELALGLEGPQGNFRVGTSVAKNDPNQGTQPPVNPHIAPEPGDSGNSVPVSRKDAIEQQPGGNNSIAPPANAETPKGEPAPAVEGPKIASPDPAPFEQPAAPLAPRWTVRDEATVTTANPENLTKALAAFAPKVDGDTLYITVPAVQRKAVEDAIRNAAGVTLVGGFDAKQTDMAGQIHSLESQVAFYGQQAANLEKQIPKLRGTEQEEAFAQLKVTQEKLENASDTLRVVKDQVDKAIINVHLQVQGR